MSFVNRKQTEIRASVQASDYGGSADPIAPLQLESPVGQFLSQILISHPHLVPAAVEQQLEQLQTDRDTEEDKEESSTSGAELVLYRRIAEVKANERRKALEEILYALVVQKFMDANVPLIPTITPSPPNDFGQVDTWPTQEAKLEGLHSAEAYEMIQNHLALILENRLGDSNSVAQISKLKVGQVYAASLMYGYFLKRIDQRFQLEKTMKILPQSIDIEKSNIEQEESGKSSFDGIKRSRLRYYVMSFDGETLYRYATIRSKEAVDIVEKHTEALFGRPEIVITPQGTIDSSKDELIKISFCGLKRLVLEAVTFGAFLWDAESYVESRYHFVAN
ncbi:hypothetical protein DH2020_038499 [Rehmannia glutinosa]|uniref:UV-B-induced protein n=1 Tax=Rehmannia glutinosa TaxID=99300 RepID=A0ABR0UYF7_REHGL